eukprot:jgi/Undpi1/11736/HiC_scaffold_37.g14031.m1
MHSFAPFRSVLHGFGVFALMATALLAQDTAATGTSLPEGAETIQIEDVRKHIEYLASDRLQGRASGTPGNEAAAKYIEKLFKKYKLKPGNKRSYMQPFEAESQRYKTVPTKNVLGFLPGTDDKLKEEIVVIGAHFDHVGVGKFGSRERGRGSLKDKIHNGADDNASGTAGLLELAEAFSRHPGRRSILFIAFSAEELGLLGSKHYVNNPTYPLAQTVAMMNFDMIGRSENGYLFLGGTGTSPAWDGWIEKHIEGAGLAVERGAGGNAPTDSTSFYQKDIPVLFFHTELHADYHRVSDHPEFINYGGEEQILRAAYSLIRSVVDHDERPGYSESNGEAMGAKSRELMALPSRAQDLARSARGAAKAKVDKKGCGRLGFSPGAGRNGEVLISELLVAGPVGKAGLKVGDVILAVNDTEVGHSKDIAAALKKVKAGTKISLDVRRKGDTEKVEVQVGK